MYRDGNTDQNKLVVAVADSGEGPGGRCPPPRLFLNQGQKKFFQRPGPPFLRVWMTGTVLLLHQFNVLSISYIHLISGND